MDQNNPPIDPSAKRAGLPEESTRVLTGVGVSAGVAIGQVVVIERLTMDIYPKHVLKPQEVHAEIQRFEAAVRRAADQLQQIKNMVEPGNPLDDHLYIFDTQLLLLEDRMFYAGTKELIATEQQNAEWALSETVGRITQAFATIEDEYLRERARDIYFVGERVMRILLGRSDDRRIHQLPPSSVIVAHDLSPADTAQLERERVLGFAIDMGGRTSHTAIMARSLKMPAVTGLERITRVVQSGETIIVDGSTGVVIANPDAETILRFKERREAYRKYHDSLLPYGRLPAVTSDGRREVRIMANVDLMDEVDIARDHGSEGIGLFRTEYLFLGRHELPSEEEQFNAYRHVLVRCAPHPVTIRTLDLGADKISSDLTFGHEHNPALGLRAIRLCLSRKDLFKAQLRAIHRAAAHGVCRLLIPMISCIGELKAVRALIREVKDELDAAGASFDASLQVGILVEVPSAVTIADIIARDVDFMSIGTNDLIQYALAIDRVNEHVTYLYDTLHPAILRMIRQVTDAAHARGVPVSMCGEMAGDPVNIPVLLGMGLDEFSMNALSVPMVKKLIRAVSTDECRDLTETALEMHDAREIRAFLEDWIRERFPDDYFVEREDEMQ